MLRVGHERLSVSTHRNALRLAAAGAAIAAVLLGVAAQSLSAASALSPGAKTTTIVLSVSTSSPTTPISPLIYGLNLSASDPGTKSVVSATRPGLLRLGGNRFTAYNWENNDSNAGSDYFFHNDGYLDNSTAPADAILPTVNLAAANHFGVIVTVPIADFVSANRCGCNVQNDANHLNVDFNQNVANSPGATPLTPDTSDHVVYQDQFVSYLKRAVANATILFSLDNEPDLWSSSHHEVHPLATTYSELLSRDIAYATMIKRVWPSAQVIGPANYGWDGMVSLQGAPDSAAKGDFLTWWLKQVHAANVAAKKTLIDQLDVHWYPEATGAGVRITGTETSAAIVAAREQAPRSLWDSHYVEKSWITNSGSGPLHLITRLQQKIANNDPGAGLDISEWNYGAGQSISGAIASADVLGIFGRYGVHAAANWPLNANEDFTQAAFSMYRNYDGHGGHFGDLEQKASTTSPITSSIYASTLKAQSGFESIIIINKSLTSSNFHLVLSGSRTFSTAISYRLSSAGSVVHQVATLHATTANRFTVSLPAQSIEMLSLR